MNYKQIYSKAKAESGYLYDEDCIRIYIASSADNPVAANILSSFREEIDKLNVEARMITAGSFGYYDLEPIVEIQKPGRPAVLYHNITPETASGLVKDYLLGENPRAELALCSTGAGRIPDILNIVELPLFNLQCRIALRNCGYIDPHSIDHYILCGKGYSGLARALQSEQEDIIQELKGAGLRGRNGAGNFTAEKWQICQPRGMF